MRSWINKYRRRRAIRAYIYELGPELASRYGFKSKKTPYQVEKLIDELGLSTNYIIYAHAIYLRQKAFNSYCRDAGKNIDYFQLKQEVSRMFPNGPAFRRTQNSRRYDVGGSPDGADGE